MKIRLYKKVRALDILNRRMSGPNHLFSRIISAGISKRGITGIPVVNASHWVFSREFLGVTRKGSNDVNCRLQLMFYVE